MIFRRCLLLLCTLLPALVTPGQQQRDSVLNRVISVHADQRPISEVLEEITRLNAIYFSFDATLISVERLITLHADRKRVGEILQEVFPDERLHFQGKNNHVIISAGEEETAGHDLPPEESPPFLVVSGRVTDQVSREPMSYVSISLQEYPVGTITNADGEFVLKLPPDRAGDTLVFSSLGYARQKRVAGRIPGNAEISLQPISIRIREVKVKAVQVEEVLEGIRRSITTNYATDHQLLTAFYRETVRQDGHYINVSEAVLEILKAPYGINERDDKVRLVKARRSPDVQPFHWVNFKLQGGPYTITMLDVVKKLETFLDPEYQLLYRYSIQQVIWYKNHPVFVVRFRPARDTQFPAFEGEMYVDRESYALLYARFSLDDYGLGMAGESLVRRKPKGFKVKPQFVEYQVDFSEYGGLWHLHTARASVAFRVRSPKDRINSVFHSVSDLLVTEVKNTSLKRFPVKDLFTVNDVFAEMPVDYDEAFWGNYNIIKPDEDLQRALKNLPREAAASSPGNETKK
ncbi:MAG TPA: carboxypeptidase-like regulatory domain-containing protein [Prolixibacteraceae bacterium]|nr:carboxypeptidase-like regulatory domain-containing protein [Prolixibacteraceae bacterium]